MQYTLDDFCADCRTILKAGQPLPQALAQISQKLTRLLANPAFVAATFTDDMPPGRRVLHHDIETDMYVLAHVQEGGKAGKPHSHGASWAIYGNALAATEMTEWRRLNPEGEDNAVLEPVDRYRVGPGETRAYGPGVIHSTAHPDRAWVIRVTGTDLDAIPRFRFRDRRDSILERA
jgi:predicted metal-dependent enzyme (double-stranded beta helix superfamily)